VPEGSFIYWQDLRGAKLKKQFFAFNKEMLLQIRKD